MMKKTMASLLGLFLWAGSAWASPVPQQLTYQGRLLDSAGTPEQGIHTVQFKIWAAATGGSTPLWSDTVSVSITDGLYSVDLGTTAGNAFPANLFDGTVRFLELTVDGDTLSPRQSVGSVAYAIQAGGVLGGAVNASDVSINGSPVIDSSGNWVGPSSGLVGPTGPTGPAGAAGAAGATGATGPTGPAGAAGATGATGAQGPQGVAGATGPTGIVDESGATGITGETGVDPTTTTVPHVEDDQGETEHVDATGVTGEDGDHQEESDDDATEVDGHHDGSFTTTTTVAGAPTSDHHGDSRGDD